MSKIDEKTCEEILRKVQDSATGLTTKKIAKAVRKPSMEVFSCLTELQNAGHVRFNNTRWKATTRRPPPSQTPPRAQPPVVPSRQVKPRPPQVKTKAQPPPPARQKKKSRWQTFRNLCEYYAECVRLDQGTTIHAKANEENLKFIYLPSISGDDRDSEGWSYFAVNDQWSPFIRALKSSSYAFLGYPMERFHWRDKKSAAEAIYCSPVFLWQVEYQIEGQWLKIRQRGLLRANEGWLERRFRDAEQRRHFLELCGLLGGAGQSVDLSHSESIDQASKLLGLYYPDICLESLNTGRIALTPTMDAVSKDGIYNRAALLLPRMNKFTRGLHHELLQIAHDIPDEDLDRSALASLFPSDSKRKKPEPDFESSNAYASFLPLNKEQRDACREVQSNALTVIFGPPGTGKSQAVIAILAQAALRSTSALFASRNHQALAAVIPRLNAITDPDQLILRLSYPRGSGFAPGLGRAIEEILSRHGIAGQREKLETEKRRKEEQLQEECSRAAELGRLIDEIYEIRDVLGDATRRLEAKMLDVPEPYRDNINGKYLLPSSREIDQLLKLLIPKWSWSPKSIIAWFRFVFTKRRLVAHAQQIEAAYCSVFRPQQHVQSAKISKEYFRYCSDTLRHWKPVALAQEVAVEVDKHRSRLEGLRDLPDLYEELTTRISLIQSATGDLMRLIAKYGASELSQENREKLSEWLAAIDNLSAADSEADQQRLERYQSKFISLLQDHIPLLATTNLSARGRLPFAAGVLELLVLDEASQCDIPSIIPLLFRCQRAVVVGDPKQLTHVTSLSAATDRQLRQQFQVADEQLERFSYRSVSAYRLADSSSKLDARILLRQHHRCHPEIADYCNQQFYQGDLVILTTGSGRGLRWTNVVGKTVGAPGGGSLCEAHHDAILSELKALQNSDFRGTVGVVTPFTQQANRLRDTIWKSFSSKELADWSMLVSTADGFQGDERDVILFSLVGSSEMPQGSLNFLRGGPNRFNVAVSRARKMLHIIGDRDWARTCEVNHIEQLFKSVEQAEAAEVRNQQAPFREDLVGPVWEPYLANKLHEAGIEFQQQYLSCAGYLDFAIFTGGQKLDIEVDGETYHRGVDGLRNIDDQLRDMALIADGWKIERFWVYELRENIENCLNRIQLAMNSKS